MYADNREQLKNFNEARMKVFRDETAFAVFIAMISSGTRDSSNADDLAKFSYHYADCIIAEKNRQSSITDNHE